MVKIAEEAYELGFQDELEKIAISGKALAIGGGALAAAGIGGSVLAHKRSQSRLPPAQREGFLQNRMRRDREWYGMNKPGIIERAVTPARREGFFQKNLRSSNETWSPAWKR